MYMINTIDMIKRDRLSSDTMMMVPEDVLGMYMIEHKKFIPTAELEKLYGKSIGAINSFNLSSVIPVYLNHGKLLHMQNALIGGLTTMQINHKPITAILLDELWEMMPVDAKEFFLYHEIGHYERGHMNSPVSSAVSNLFRSFGWSKSVKIECEADEYAASKTSNQCGINAMQWLLRNCILSEVSKTEVEKRLLNLYMRS